MRCSLGILMAKAIRSSTMVDKNCTRPSSWNQCAEKQTTATAHFELRLEEQNRRVLLHGYSRRAEASSPANIQIPGMPHKPGRGDRLERRVPPLDG